MGDHCLVLADKLHSQFSPYSSPFMFTKQKVHTTVVVWTFRGASKGTCRFARRPSKQSTRLFSPHIKLCVICCFCYCGQIVYRRFLPPTSPFDKSLYQTKNSNQAKPDLSFCWCEQRDLNPHGLPLDPKSSASANSAMLARRNKLRSRY